MMPPTVKMIWAQGLNRAIGKDNTIPWRLKEDMQFFQKHTYGATVIMGKNTWLSLPASSRPLSGRWNVVLSRNPETFDHAGAECFPSLKAALTDMHQDDLVWIIGGASVYEAGFEYADEIYVTEIDLEVENADAFAPEIPANFLAVEATEWAESDKGLKYRFIKYVKG